jgi:hypothetical protein
MIALGLLAACGQPRPVAVAEQAAPTVARPANEVWVGLRRDGRIEIDGRAAKVQDLGPALDRVKAMPGGKVAYWREGAREKGLSAEMSVVAEVVIEEIVARELPLRLTSRADFSDYIDAAGQCHPYIGKDEPKQSVVPEKRS